MTSLGARPASSLAVVVAGAVVATSAALMAGSGIVLSRWLSWDLLFNLSGAWHLHHGRMAHVDFRDPLGQLAFSTTQLGFWLCGPKPMAFIVGEIIATAVAFAAAAVASLPRLRPAAATVFMLFVSLMVLMPVNVGDGPTDFTFAMSYNARGWAAISVLSLVLFLPRHRADEGAWTDAALGGLLMLAMYYLKMTYFVAGLVELTVAFLVSRHIRCRPWFVAAGLVVANAVAPYNWPYLGDLADILGSPGSFDIYVEAGRIKGLLHASVPELVIYAVAGGIALGLWLSGRVPLSLLLVTALLDIVGTALLVFNTQARGNPLAAVALFLLYQRMASDATLRRAAPLMLAFPLALAAAAAASIAAYYAATLDKNDLMVVDRTNLRGLAVPDRDAPPPPGEIIDDDDYVRTLLEAADLLKHTHDGGVGVMLLDQINPMPFVMGVPPRRGARLWWDTEYPWPAAETAARGANHVLIPKRPVNGDVTRKALELYGPYLAEHFPVRTESPSWTLLSRER